MIRRPPRSTQSRSSAASDVYKRQVRRYDLAMVDDGASLTTGVGGVGDVRMQALDGAHVGHALARPGYVFGRAVLAKAEDPWCDDGRCAAFAPSAEAAP